jgi:hypothetical protein
MHHPTNPPANIAWQGSFAIAGIEAAVNHARRQENSWLGSSIAPLALPAAWSSWGDGERACWLTNRERVDRGIHPLHGLERNVTAVAQQYAEHMLRHGRIGHQADGRTPWQRLSSRTVIQDHHDFLPQVENLAYFWSTEPIPSPVERALYAWLYEDQQSRWLHRTAMLQYPFTDNTGPAGQEGFMGVGRASGPMHYQGRSWPYAEIIVVNYFDPGAQWPGFIPIYNL